MRIEINAGGLGGGVAIVEYQLNMANFITQSEDVIDAFKAVRTSTYNLSGGVGNLSGAVSDLSTRITEEEQNKNSATEIRRQSNEFLDLAIRVDKQVATLVKQNSEKFYQVHPWLRPPVPEEDKPWYEKAWETLCGTVSDVVENVKAAWEGLKEFVGDAWEGMKNLASKAWESIVSTVKNACDFLVHIYEENIELINGILKGIVIIGAAILTVATSGLAAGLLIATIASVVSSGIVAGLDNITKQVTEKGSLSEVNWAETFGMSLVGAGFGLVFSSIGNLASSLFKSGWGLIISKSVPLQNFLLTSSRSVGIISDLVVRISSEVLGGFVVRPIQSITENLIFEGKIDFDDVKEDTFYIPEIIKDIIVPGGTYMKKRLSTRVAL